MAFQRTQIVFCCCVFATPFANGQEVLSQTTKNEVLVYFANETAPTARELDNYGRVIGWLRSSSTSAEVATDLEADREQFPSIVDQEVETLQAAVRNWQDVGGLVIATNRLVRDKCCSVWSSNSDRTVIRDLHFDPSHADYIRDANPLSRPEILFQLFGLIAKEFDPEQYRFTLIIKSHGSKDRVVTPRLTLRSDQAVRQVFLQFVESPPEIANRLPEFARDRVGIRKHEFLELLKEAGDSLRIQFSLVFLEACYAPNHEFTANDLPVNVERLLIITGNAGYSNLDYEQVSRSCHDVSITKALLRATANDSDFALIKNDFSMEIPKLVFLLPAGVWLIVWTGIAASQIRRRRRKTTAR